MNVVIVDDNSMLDLRYLIVLSDNDIETKESDILKTIDMKPSI